MGWGLEVPKGWKRGEPIRFIGSGPRYGCLRNLKEYSIGAFDPADYAIEFDSADEANAFRRWWFSTEDQPK